MTVEHVLPLWIGEELQVTGGIETHRGPGTNLLFGHEELSVELRAVCEGCNGGWMASLEGRARPILAPMMRNDGPADLSPADLTLAAAWAVKTALLLELATKALRGTAFAPTSHFQELHRTQLPPAGVQTWLLGVNAAPARRLATSFGGWLEDASGAKTGYVATFHVGMLGFQVIGQTCHGEVANLPPVPVPDPVQPFLVPVWPSSEHETWPPQAKLPVEQLPLIAGWPGRVVGDRTGAILMGQPPALG